MDDAQSIAQSLSEAQRRAVTGKMVRLFGRQLLQSIPTSTLRVLRRKGLTEAAWHESSTLTPLGIEVRRFLQERQP